MCDTGVFYAHIHSAHLPSHISKEHLNIEYSVAWIQATRFTFLLQQMRHKPEASIPHTSLTVYFSMLINATQKFLGDNLLNQWGEMEKSDVPDFYSIFDNLAS